MVHLIPNTAPMDAEAKPSMIKEAGEWLSNQLKSVSRRLVPPDEQGGDGDQVQERIWAGAPPRVVGFRWVPRSELRDTDPHARAKKT